MSANILKTNRLTQGSPNFFNRTPTYPVWTSPPCELEQGGGGVSGSHAQVVWGWMGQSGGGAAALRAGEVSCRYLSCRSHPWVLLQDPATAAAVPAPNSRGWLLLLGDWNWNQGWSGTGGRAGLGGASFLPREWLAHQAPPRCSSTPP